MSRNIRFHQKSRTGCNGCKARRVKASSPLSVLRLSHELTRPKCDEAKPQCSACSRRSVECVYQPTQVVIGVPDGPATPGGHELNTNSSVSQQPPESPRYSSRHLLDLRLMHHYSIFTTQSFANALRSERVSAALQRDIPQLALEHEFLMDTILLVAMVHLASTDPVSLQTLPVLLYRDQALRSFRQAVANISEHNIIAVRSASHLLVAISFAADRVTDYPGPWVTNWLALAVGQRSFTHESRAEEKSDYDDDDGDGVDHDNGVSLYADPLTPAVLFGHNDGFFPTEESDDDWIHRDTLCEAATEIRRLIAILKLPHEQLALEVRIKTWVFDKMPPEFLNMIRQERPRALVILAYYLVFLRFLPDTWLYQDVANHDLAIVQNKIGANWRKYLSVPSQALQMEDKVAVAELLANFSPA